MINDRTLYKAKKKNIFNSHFMNIAIDKFQLGVEKKGLVIFRTYSIIEDA